MHIIDKLQDRLLLRLARQDKPDYTWVILGNGLHQFRAVHVRHSYVAYNNIDMLLFKMAKCFFGTGAKFHLPVIAKAVEQSAYRRKQRRIVIDEQDTGFFRTHSDHPR